MSEDKTPRNLTTPLIPVHPFEGMWVQDLTKLEDGTTTGIPVTDPSRELNGSKAAIALPLTTPCGSNEPGVVHSWIMVHPSRALTVGVSLISLVAESGYTPAMAVLPGILRTLRDCCAQMSALVDNRALSEYYDCSSDMYDDALIGLLDKTPAINSAALKNKENIKKVFTQDF